MIYVNILATFDKMMSKFRGAVWILSFLKLFFVYLFFIEFIWWLIISHVFISLLIMLSSAPLRLQSAQASNLNTASLRASFDLFWSISLAHSF